MTRSHLLLSLALTLGWTLEQETEDRVQARYGDDTPDAPRVDWLAAQVNADDAGEAGDLLFTALLDKLRHPHGEGTSPIACDPLSTDTKAICAELSGLTAAYREGACAHEEVREPPQSRVALLPHSASRASELLQVNQAVLGLLQRQIEAEERVYGRFCDMIERTTDKIANAVLQGQSTQLAHEQWLKQADQAKANEAQTDAVTAVLERFAAATEEQARVMRERLELDRAEAAQAANAAPPQGTAPTPSGGFA